MNIHFATYNRWKQTTLALIAALLIALTITQAIFYYKISNIQKKITSVCLQQKDVGPTNNKQILEEINHIDRQELFAILDALLEIMPPSVKVEKFEYTKTNIIITCKAQHHQAMVTMIERCAKNSILKKLSLKKSSQEKDELLFVLA